MALEIVLGTAIEQLLRVIEQEREADFRYESILNGLKSTLESAFPKISEIYQLRESNGLQNDELHGLLEQLEQAKETVNKCSQVACWNNCKKRKYLKQLLKLDADLRKFFLIDLPIDHYKNITLIQVQLKNLAQILERLVTGKSRIYNRSRSKVSDAAGGLKKMVQSLPRLVFMYLISVMRFPKWGYKRIKNSFYVYSKEKGE
ncbi:hypothetical protein PTKIN_Ptkin08bG0170100 [Pterospermum kingtungense]